jgi:N-acetyl-gamma-glutamylphosphate reductase
MKAIVIGGTGQVGRQLVRALLLRPEYTKVVSVSRRKLPSDITESVKQATPSTSADKLHEVILNDMTKLNQIRPNILQHSTNGEVFDAAFSALGVRYPNALSEKGNTSKCDINLCRNISE